MNLFYFIDIMKIEIKIKSNYNYLGNYMVKEISSNISGVQGSPFPEENAKRLTEKEKKTEGTAQEALTGPPVIEVIPEARTQRRVSTRNFLQGLVNLISRIGQLFSRMNPARLSGRDRTTVVRSQELQLPQLSMEEIKELNSQLKSAIEAMEKFHFEPINTARSEDEIEKLDHKDEDIKEIQKVIGEVFGLIEALPDNDPLKTNADIVLTSLRNKLRDIKEHYSALEAKYGDKTARFIQQLKQNDQFNALFGNVVEVLVKTDSDLDKKLTDYVVAFSPIVKQFTGKANPGTEEIQSVLEAGFLKLKESNPNQFNELKTIIENAEELPVVQIEGHPNVVLNLQLLTLKQMILFVSEAA